MSHTNDTSSSEPQINDELECQGCGAILRYKPGTNNLICMYCGAENAIFKPEELVVIIEETSLEAYFTKGLTKEERMEIDIIQCSNCGGSFTFEKNVTSGFCPFCNNSIVIEGGTNATIYKPKYLLPFDFDHTKAASRYSSWLKGLWFAPNDLKHYSESNDHFTGIYIPYWTYDCETNSRYTGARGDDYTENRRINVVENGRNVTRNQSVTRTRWTNVSGEVGNSFDDILVIASHSIDAGLMAKIKAWDLGNLVPFNEKYLSGFRTESYTVNIEQGYEIAKKKMDHIIAATVRGDIGGNRQRINQVITNYTGATFKQILIPVWISAYRYKGKVFQFVVNGRTGAVAGKRPYSIAKITLTVMGVLLAILLIVLIGN